jgi:hypothetical protein
VTLADPQVALVAAGIVFAVLGAGLWAIAGRSKVANARTPRVAGERARRRAPGRTEAAATRVNPKATDVPAQAHTAANVTLEVSAEARGVTPAVLTHRRAQRVVYLPDGSVQTSEK